MRGGPFGVPTAENSLGSFRLCHLELVIFCLHIAPFVFVCNLTFHRIPPDKDVKALHIKESGAESPLPIL